MDDARQRFTRQIRLAEIGEKGQEALARAEVAPGAQGAARVVETRYLERAGVTVRDANVPGGPAPSIDAALEALAFERAAARDVAEGSLRALVALRAILGLDGG